MAEYIFRRFTFKQLLIYAVSAIAIALFLGYSIFEARKLLEGPQIFIAAPQDWAEVGGPLFTIRGNIQNAAFFSINGNQTFADEQGNFTDQLSLPPGYAVVEVAARDRFGRTTVKDLHLNVADECLL